MSAPAMTTEIESRRDELPIHPAADMFPSMPPDEDRPICQHCGEPFTARQGTGGRPQRFCSTKCLQAAHAARGPTSKTLGNDAATSPPAAPSDARTKLIADLVVAGVDADLVGRVAAVLTGAVRATGRPEVRSDLEDFDWASEESVVLREQPTTAMYWNRVGQLVIRQEAGPLDDGDSFVFVANDQLRQFIDRLCDVAGIGGAP